MKTFSEFIAEATVMPTWGELNKTPEQRAADAKKREFQKSAGQARVMPTFAELQKKRAAGMTEDEIIEFLGIFGKKKTPPIFANKNKHTRTGHGDQAYRTDHSYSVGSDIDPKTVPEFKSSWRTAGRS